MATEKLRHAGICDASAAVPLGTTAFVAAIDEDKFFTSVWINMKNLV